MIGHLFMAIDENRKFLPGVSIISIKIIFAVKSPENQRNAEQIHIINRAFTETDVTLIHGHRLSGSAAAPSGEFQ